VYVYWQTPIGFFNVLLQWFGVLHTPLDAAPSDTHSQPPATPPPLFTHLQWVRTLVLVVCLGWASWATVPFIGKTVSQE
jgi:hypothetical protein